MNTGPEPSREIREALRELDVLNDGEHEILEHWFSSGWRTWLYRVGIGDDVIGPHRSEIEDHDDLALPLSDEQKAVADVNPSRQLVAVLLLLRELPKRDFDAIANWFIWQNRRCLYEIGVTDDEIGKKRVVPDDTGPGFQDYYPRP